MPLVFPQLVTTMHDISWRVKVERLNRCVIYSIEDLHIESEKYTPLINVTFTVLHSTLFSPLSQLLWIDIFLACRIFNFLPLFAWYFLIQELSYLLFLETFENDLSFVIWKAGFKLLFLSLACMGVISFPFKRYCCGPLHANCVFNISSINSTSTLPMGFPPWLSHVQTFDKS